MWYWVQRFWDEVNGFNYDFFEAVDTTLPTIVKEKCEAPVVHIGESAGNLAVYYQQLWNLPEKVQISPYMIDAHSGVLGAGLLNKVNLQLLSAQVPVI